MEHIIITDTMNSVAPAALFLIVFLSIILYLALTMSVEKSRYNDLKKAQRLIEAGHKKAVKGKKNDGIYNEKKRLKEEASCLEEKKRAAVAEAKRDLALLSGS